MKRSGTLKRELNGLLRTINVLLVDLQVAQTEMIQEKTDNSSHFAFELNTNFYQSLRSDNPESCGFVSRHAHLRWILSHVTRQ